MFCFRKSIDKIYNLYILRLSNVAHIKKNFMKFSIVLAFFVLLLCSCASETTSVSEVDQLVNSLQESPEKWSVKGNDEGTLFRIKYLGPQEVTLLYGENYRKEIMSVDRYGVTLLKPRTRFKADDLNKVRKAFSPLVDNYLRERGLAEKQKSGEHKKLFW